MQRSRVWGFAAREPALLVLVSITAIVDAAYSILRQVHLQTSLDLAIFDQAVWHYSRFQAPFSSIKGEDLLGDHFHPIVALLAPLYWIWSDPRTLLIAQSVLVASSVVPVFLFARARIGRGGAYLVAVAYAVFWGIQNGVGYDFHEVALGPLLIATAVLLADRRHWRAFWIVIVLLLGVKEDLAIFVIFFGLYLLTRREVRHGIALVVVGVLWYELATHVLIPHFAGGKSYTYWSYTEFGSNPVSAALGMLRAPWRVFTVAFSPAQKWHTLLLLLGPFLFLSLFSRLFILAIPLLLERFLSTTDSYWGTSFQYSLTIAPVLAMAAAAGVANLRLWLSGKQAGSISHARWTRAAAGAMLVASVAVTLALGGQNALAGLHQASTFRQPLYAAAAERAVEHVPANAALTTVDVVLPQASQRNQIYLLSRFRGVSDYLLAPVGRPVGDGTGFADQDALGNSIDADLELVTPVYYDDGWLVARKPPPGQRPTNGVLAPMDAGQGMVAGAAAHAWVVRISIAGARFGTCSAIWRSDRARAARCFAVALRGFHARVLDLATTLTSVVASLRGGCHQLGGLAQVASAHLSADLTRFVAAANATSPLPLAAATRTFVTDYYDRDLSGIFNRFFILCTSR